MKKIMTILCVALLASNPAFAEKPEWAGKGKPTAEQKDAHRSAMQAKEDLDGDIEDVGEKVKSEKEKLKGLEKQQAKKAEMEMKELDKGSETGQEARETRKKWWQFWGE